MIPIYYEKVRLKPNADQANSDQSAVSTVHLHMEQPAGHMTYDVIIVGAGPAGCACALALKGSGLKVALIDKATFPRDKVCGDAIPGRAIRILTQIDQKYGAAFARFPSKCATKTTALYYKDSRISFDWVREAYTCTRMEFDNFLFTLVKENTDTEIYTDTLPQAVTNEADGFTLNTTTHNFKCKLLIGADGAQSPLAKQLAGKTMNREHHVGSVRAYYANIAGTMSDTTEIYFDKKFLPSYLWVFPLPDNMANVGFGMLSSEIARRKINIKNTFYSFIENVPELKSRFKDAVQQGPLEGFGLPLGSNIGTISGDNYMLIGDAASLIDPISGDGIGNAMLSGKLAAQQAISSFQKNDSTAVFLKGYDRAVTKAIGSELRTHYRAQRIMSKMPGFLDAAFYICQNKALKRLVQKGL